MTDMRLERGAATRERLIGAARRLFGERGYEATSIQLVLSRAGVARGALYHHFDSKEALFDAVLEEIVAEVAEQAANAARAAGTDPVANLRAASNTWLEVALDTDIQRITLLDAPAVVGWKRWRELDEQHTLGGLKQTLQRIADDGRLPPESVDVLAHMILAAVAEAALLIARADDPRAALREGKAAVDTLLGRLVGSDA
jgi:AcrR family transcriptional regulator